MLGNQKAAQMAIIQSRPIQSKSCIEFAVECGSKTRVASTDTSVERVRCVKCFAPLANDAVRNNVIHNDIQICMWCIYIYYTIINRNNKNKIELIMLFGGAVE